MASALFQRKPLHMLQGDAEHASGLKRVLGPLELTMLGIGAIIGTGIFVLTGTAAAGGADHAGAGPAIVYSFIIVGFACALAALCYAEFASMIPIAGSAYTYAYASFGELAAWIIGWDLILEYAVGNIAVAIGWGGYFKEFIEYFGLHFPAWLAIDPMTMHNALASPDTYGGFEAAGSVANIAREAMATAPNLGFHFVINLPAFLVVAFVTALLVYGVKESARLNTGLVFLKLGLIALFLFVGLQHVDFQAHWAGLNEAGQSKFMPSGWSGVMTGGALIFFAYIGFDAVSTTAEEARNPQKDLPFGMIMSLVVCTILYIIVAVVLTGMVPLNTLANAHPVAAALQQVGAPGVATIISLGASMAIVSVLLVMQYAQTRIFFSMSRDGLLPKVFSKVHPRFHTPVTSTILTGLLVGIPAALIDIAVAAELSNIGTLFAFVLVAGGVMILRVKEPERHRGFRVSLVWVVAPLCILICMALMIALPWETWVRFFVWLVLGLALYWAYGAKHSTLRNGGVIAPVVDDGPATLSPADKEINIAGRDREV